MIALSWLLSIFATLVAWICFYYVAPAWVRPVDSKLIQTLFLPSTTGYCLPEPLEQLRYLLILVSFVGTTFVSFLTLTQFKKTSADHPLVMSLAIAAQLALTGWFILNWRYQSEHVFAYFNEWDLAGATVLGLVIAGAAFKSGARLRGLASPKLAYILAGLYVLIRLLPSVYTDQNLDLAYGPVSYHLAYTLDEFAAVLNGRTLLVDFFSQYQNLSPYLLAPVFRVFGLSITSFTLMMCTLSATMMAWSYRYFLRITADPWIALALYLPWVGLSFYTEAKGNPGEWLTPFNYFAVGPLRYFGPWCVLALACRYFARRSGVSLLLAFFVSGLVAINNLDFGLTASLAIFLGVALSPPNRGFLNEAGNFSASSYLRWLGYVTGFYLLSISIAISMFLALTLTRSGQLPHFSRLFFFQHTFAIYGFSMLPLPELGLYWIILSTFLAAVVVMVTRMGDGDGARALRTGMLGTSGFFGFGALAYYIGRSHTQVLPAVFCAWGFTLMLLVWEQILFWKEEGRGSPGRFRYALTILPGLLLGFLYVAAFAQTWLVPNPALQIRRILKNPGHSHEERFGFLAQLIRTNSRPHRKVMVLYPYAHQLANQARVDNIFPFAHPGSLVLFEQIHETLGAIYANHVCEVFGVLPVELLPGLNQAHFSRTLKYQDFDIWTRLCE